MSIKTTYVTSYQKENLGHGFTFNVELENSAGKKSPSVIHVDQVSRSLAMINLDRRRSIDRLISAVSGCFAYESNFFEELKKAFRIRADNYIAGFVIYHRGVTLHVSPRMNDEERLFEEWLRKKAALDANRETNASASEN